MFEARRLDLFEHGSGASRKDSLCWLDMCVIIYIILCWANALIRCYFTYLLFIR